jgi:phosphatidylserine decarboxylase
MDAIKAVFVPINREGYRFVAIFALVTLLLFWLAAPLGWIGVVATLWCVYFFRDPDRTTPIRTGLVISPADGIVLPIKKAAPPAELNLGSGERTRISIFMNVFDVHVNRIPCDGEITAQYYFPGKFFNASLDKASEHNERQAVAMRTLAGNDVVFVQIAGLVARRIVCTLMDGQEVSAGERFGMIRFGSRVDVYLPDGVEPLVAAGQRCVAGESVLADEKSAEKRRLGETR